MNLNIVFDLDGTLITCENKQKYVLHSILNKFDNIDAYSLNTWWKLKRNGYNTEKALIKIGISNAEYIAKEWIRIIENSTWCSLDRPYEDSLSTLDYLKNVPEFKISILTARKFVHQVYQVITMFGFNALIDDLIVVKPEEGIQKKTHYLKRIEPLIYIGDSEVDHFASLNSKTRFVALTRGQRSRGFLKKVGVIQIENNLKFLRNDDFISRLKKNQ